MGYFRENSNKKGENMEFPGLLKKNEYGKSRCQLKKKWNFISRGVIKKKSCGISMGLGFWPWKFQWVKHNFVEFQRRNFNLSGISKGKVTDLKIPGQGSF